MQKHKKLFALDIGTRSVIGIILEEQDGHYHVVDSLVKEHTERAMLDGQIHDVLSVSKIISEIKQQLEEKHGPLKKVCVAAAGRALKTERSKVTIDINGKPLIKNQDILHLELSAVQQAQSVVAEKHESEQTYYYYCVGYSVLYYRLDGEEIGNLIDQQGKEASVEIIATFLPKVVVESLLSALHRAGLEMEALTLEPIAAIHVLIPPSMRRLNVALVDIGAGTSDIAITDLGTVIAYGMVPVAGDEITEAISDQLLLDFPFAEEAKRELYKNDTITVTDILGFETEVRKEDLVSQISPVLDRLASSICNEIFELNNNKPPKAVMLVGGGSLTPELPKRVAEKLNLPENRVAIRGIDAIRSLTIADHIAQGPELVTPIGIAIAAHHSPVQYKTVYVNEQPVRLFEVKKLTVGDCLLAAGIKMNKLYGKPGLALIVTLNGQNITIPGGHGDAPVILLNGQVSSLDSEIENGDQLHIEKGKDGQRAELQIKDLIDEIPKREVMINENDYSIEAIITCNRKVVSADNFVEDRDVIECKIPESIEDLLTSLNLHEYIIESRPFRVKINEKETFIPSFSGKVYRNGIEVKLHNSYEHKDHIIIEKKMMPTIKELAEVKQIMLSHTIPISFNGENIHLHKPISIIRRNNTILAENDPIQDGDHIVIEHRKLEPFLFQDLFGHVDIEMPAQANGNFVLLKNGEQATFHSRLEPGDDLTIVWPSKQKTSI
ncbi:cell division protein FtsA [Cytobacillus solani]|uniref:Cell division protein n=1 Tax=Cytobacillus solani TaxID=1637975 RepID=A0A0Q3VJA0_9BACI|nr:cell division protein FtsA [Cytobacillus solani]KOP83764.1 cell division protein [Bacillus sp. FJAT-21945]KQL20842.1 cell division protein [Cytobacillus solani]USK54081.1 cell division protein FtsA [Cytobacillus solani]